MNKQSSVSEKLELKNPKHEVGKSQEQIARRSQTTPDLIERKVSSLELMG